jgi:hypothetical protein
MSGETAAATTLSLGVILPRLDLFCFSGQVCILLQGDPNFRRLEFCYHQIAFVKDITESRYHIPVALNALMTAFDCPRSRVQAALAHGLDDPGQRRKHIALD